jgi:hypothetical protein
MDDEYGLGEILPLPLHLHLHLLLGYFYAMEQSALFLELIEVYVLLLSEWELCVKGVLDTLSSNVPCITFDMFPESSLRRVCRREIAQPPWDSD